MLFIVVLSGNLHALSKFVRQESVTSTLGVNLSHIPCFAISWSQFVNNSYIFIYHTVPAPKYHQVSTLWTGVGNCPILGILDITWKSSHLVDHIPFMVGWCSMGTSVMTHVEKKHQLTSSSNWIYPWKMVIFQFAMLVITRGYQLFLKQPAMTSPSHSSMLSSPGRTFAIPYGRSSALGGSFGLRRGPTGAGAAGNGSWEIWVKSSVTLHMISVFCGVNIH